MAKKIYVLGIGGTGMRCIESLVHLCAMGMFDDTEVNMLALDTDKDNGNFSRLKDLNQAYNNVKGINKNKVALSDTLFSANIKYYEFSPNYEKMSTFRDVFNYDDAKYKGQGESEISDLILTEDVQSFNLRHGYRAQTHLGSMMMYNAILEASIDPQSQIREFISSIITESQNGNPRIFIMGSVFGGTGASSIPVIPLAISEAANLISGGATDIEKNTFFGSTLLTAYFSFKIPSDAEKSKQKIIASSDKFALNSQVAMMFYEDDETVKNTYQRFYMLGTPDMSWEPSPISAETITGGSRQINKSHYIELMSACAALDFFNLDDATLQRNKDKKDTDYLYRTIDSSGKLEFSDFVGDNMKDVFAKKFGMLVVASLLCNLDCYDFFHQAKEGDLKTLAISGYEDIDAGEVKALKDYFTLFHAGFSNGCLYEGWLRQLHLSAGGGDKFLFTPELFSCSSTKDFEKFDINDKIYQAKSNWSDKKYKVGLFSNKFNPFKTEFVKTENEISKDIDIVNKCERLIKVTYKTLSNLYGFE